MKLLIQAPTRQRPDQFFENVQAALDLMTGPPDGFEFNVILDNDDKSMCNPEVIARLCKLPRTAFYFDPPSTKIRACNAHLGPKVFDILVLLSDDMRPVVKGWDDIVRERMLNHFPDTDGVLWFNDGFRGHELNTLCILGRKYYRRFGYIYHPAYKSMWADNEFMEVAAGLKKQKYFRQVIIEHRHPGAGKAKYDDLYRRNDVPMGADGTTFRHRKAAGFPA